MKRRNFLQLMGSSICFNAIGCSTTSTNSKSALPNIILCMADDQGWGDMAYNGHQILKTPNFDEMAASALRFDRFYAAAPVCSPTRGSVMTGRHPNRFGCFKWGHTLRPQEITIAELLKETGYATGHFGKWHLGSVRKTSPVNPGESGFDEWFSAPNYFDNNPILSREGIAEPRQGESSLVTANAAIEFIRKHTQQEKPFFAVIWFGSPHAPHEAVLEDRELYSDQPENFQHFYGEITAMDRAFGKIREEIQNLGIKDNTILWYCSDNGGLPNLGSTGGRGNKGQVYEGGLRVPAILEWPALIKEHRVTNLPCNTSDILPTLVEIVGIRLKDKRPLDGISLVPLFKGQMQKRTKPMGFWDFPVPGIRASSKEFMEELLTAQKSGDEIGDRSRLRLESIEISKQYPEDTFPGHAAWLDWPWKLHRIQKNSNEMVWELYHLLQDPGENNNVLAEETNLVFVMKTALEEWQISVLRSLNGKDYP